MLTRLAMVIISQYVQTSHCYVVHLKLTSCYVSVRPPLYGPVGTHARVMSQRPFIVKVGATSLGVNKHVKTSPALSSRWGEGDYRAKVSQEVDLLLGYQLS